MMTPISILVICAQRIATERQVWVHAMLGRTSERRVVQARHELWLELHEAAPEVFTLNMLARLTGYTWKSIRYGIMRAEAARLRARRCA